MKRNPVSFTFEEIEALCRDLRQVSDFDRVLDKAVCEEQDEWKAYFKCQVPRRPYTSRQARKDLDRAREDVALWFSQDFVNRGREGLPRKLRPEDVIRCRRGRLLVWALAQQLRAAGARGGFGGRLVRS